MKLSSSLLVSISLALCLRWGAVEAQTNGIEAQWAGCFDQDGAGRKIKIGDPMFLCLQVGNARNWTAGVDVIQLAFAPDADEYSRFHVPDSFKDLAQGGRFQSNSLTVGVAVQRSVSFLRLFKEGEDSGKEYSNRKIYPHLTAIIDVDGGVVRGITWDDACVFCGGFGCDEITYDFDGNLQDRDSAGQPTGGCGKTMDECERKLDESIGVSTDCDLFLYVVWTGTDADGKNMLSSANRFSAFPVQNIRDRLTQTLPDAAKERVNDNAATRDL